MKRIFKNGGEYVWVWAILLCMVSTVWGQVGSDDRPWAARFAHGAVACDHPLASRAGAMMLEKGGNAVDAAVAAGFVLSVVRLESCGLGGGGFMVIYLPNDPTHGTVKQTLTFRETAPAASTPDMFETTDLPDASTRSGLAVAVPGTVAGLLDALETYGTLDRATVLQPAIDAAVGGFIADHTFVEAAQRAAANRPEAQRTADDPFWDDMIHRGEVKVGQRMRNLDQAMVLSDIAQRGRVGFDEGRAGRQLVKAAQQAGGILTLDDVQHYQPIWADPIEFSYGGNTFLTMPPPSSGGVVFA